MSTNIQKVTKILSLLSKSERVAIQRGAQLAEALQRFDRLGPHQKRIAASIINEFRGVELTPDGVYIHLAGKEGD